PRYCARHYNIDLRLTALPGPQSCDVRDHVGHRQLDVEGRAAAETGRVDPDPAVHAVHELAADVEAEAGPADAAGHVRVEPVELLEDPPLLRGRAPEARLRERDTGV